MIFAALSFRSFIPGVSSFSNNISSSRSIKAAPSSLPILDTHSNQDYIIHVGTNCTLCEYYVKVGEYVISNKTISRAREIIGLSKNCLKPCILVCCMITGKHDYFEASFWSKFLNFNFFSYRVSFVALCYSISLISLYIPLKSPQGDVK